MFTHLINIVSAAWQLFTSASIYIVFGLIVAGLIHAFLRKDRIAKYLGGNRLHSVVNAAILGVPLPLCSCGVLPAAVGLRKNGASKAATLSFLISTPESGVDSIAVTYALIDPIMAIIRPVAAFVTALCAGIAEMLFGTTDARPVNVLADGTTTHASAIGTPARDPVWKRLRTGLRYAFTTILADIAPTFLLGILLGGIISYLIPTSFIESYLGTGWTAMLMMLIVGIPLYICASASTPIAAALILKGMSPGAALVFLLAGPATNITAIPVIAKSLGWRSVAIYLGSITVCALLFGMATNWLYGALALDIRASLAQHQHAESSTLRTIVAVLLLITMLVMLARQRWRRR